MAEYYYFGASLPMLRMNQAPQLSYEAFIEACRENLSKRDMKDMELAVLSGGEGEASIPVVKAFRRFSSELGKAINHQRALSLGFSGYEEDSTDKEIRDIAKNIVNEKDPLKAENEILAVISTFSHHTKAPLHSLRRA